MSGRTGSPRGQLRHVVRLLRAGGPASLEDAAVGFVARLAEVSGRERPPQLGATASSWSRAATLATDRSKAIASAAAASGEGSVLITSPNGLSRALSAASRVSKSVRSNDTRARL